MASKTLKILYDILKKAKRSSYDIRDQACAEVIDTVTENILKGTAAYHCSFYESYYGFNGITIYGKSMADRLQLRISDDAVKFNIRRLDGYGGQLYEIDFMLPFEATFDDAIQELSSRAYHDLETYREQTFELFTKYGNTSSYEHCLKKYKQQSDALKTFIKKPPL